MKHFARSLRPQFLVLAVLACFAAVGTEAAPGAFSVSPAAITNDYQGKVTLTITGLTNGQTVKVERLLNFNGNNTVDPEDYVIRTAIVTDGQLPLIGGVRNLNEPGDEDGVANGTIVVRLNVPGLDSVFGNASGSYLFRVSDPASGFASVLQPFTVAQKSYPQAVTGRLTAAAAVGGQPLTNTLVALLPATRSGGPVSTALTDANGNFTLLAPAGSYAIFPLAKGFYVDQSANGTVITAGVTNTLDLALAVGAFTVTGSVTNSTKNSGVAGIVVFAEGNTNLLFAAAITDANGNYSLSLPQDQWKINPDEGQLAQHGLVALQNNLTTIITNASTINFAYQRATALIYGTVKDNLNQPVLGLGVRGRDQGFVYEAAGGSCEANGGYSLGVFAGTWSVGPDSDALLALGFAPGGGTNVTLTTGQALAADIVLRRVTARLRGQIRDNTGAAITNFTLVVQPSRPQPNGAGSSYPSTDASGNFDVGVYAGTWEIALECVAAQSSGYVVTHDYIFAVVDNVDQNNLVLTFPRATATINGTVKNSLNSAIAGVTLDAYATINGTNYNPGCVMTDASGNYQIRTLGGSWNVSVRNNDLNSRGYSGVTNQTVTIAGNTATANFVALPVPTTFALPTRLGANQFRFTVTTPAPVVYGYSFQYSTNARPGTWVTLLTTNPTTGSFQFTDTTATNAARFYRVTSP